MSSNKSSRDCVLFFSRGRGRGHAIPDIAIAEEVIREDPTFEVLFVSYSTGAATIREFGHTVIDLELPECNPLWETMIRAVRVIADARPLLVVTHEELCALPAAKAFHIPAVFITDWFPNDEGLQCLNYADEVIFIDEPGYFDVPPAVAEKTRYVGQVFRAFERMPLDKAAARLELAIPSDLIIILVMPGSGEIYSAGRSPMFELVLGAYDALEVPTKRLIWVAGGKNNDYELLSERTRDRRDVVVQRPHRDVHVTMMACDLAITKGNRKTSFELAALGIPSISISFGTNPIDDYRLAHLPTNRAVRARGLNSMQLKELMAADVGRKRIPVRPELMARGRMATADRLLHHLRRARGA